MQLRCRRAADVAPGGRLVDAGVQCRVVRRHETFDHPVVELHHLGQAAPVLLQILHRHVFRSQSVAGLFMQDAPVAAPPAVDRLLDVAYDEYRGLLALRHGVFQQGQEVLPFAHRGVLEFVYHEAVVAGAGLFINERRVVAADEFREQVFGFREQQHVLFVAETLYLGIQIGEQSEAAVVFAQQIAGVPRADVACVNVA